MSITKPFAKITQQDFEIAATFFENDKYLDEFISNVFRYYFKKPLTIKTKNVKKYFETYKKTMDFIISSKEFGAKRVDNKDFEEDTLREVVEGMVVDTLAAPLPPNSKEKIVNSKEETEKQKEGLAAFDLFRKVYPGTKNGNETEFSNFKKKHKDWNAVLPNLETIIKNQIKHKEQLKSQGQFVPAWKNLSTWINKRCWEEEFVAAPQPKKQMVY